LILSGNYFSADLGDSSKYSVEKNWESKQRKVSGEQCLNPSKSVLIRRLNLLKVLMENVEECFRSKILRLESYSHARIKPKVLRKGNNLNDIIHTIELWQATDTSVKRNI